MKKRRRRPVTAVTNNGASTHVGAFTIPVRQRDHPTLGIFSAGARGGHERGLYFFWTAVLRPPYVGQRRVTARARAMLAPGERFERFKREQRTARRSAAREANAWLWERVLRQGSAIRYIRPANEQEVAGWVRAHADDSRHLTGLQVGPPQPRPKPEPPPEPPVIKLLPESGAHDLDAQEPDSTVLHALRRGWRRVWRVKS